MRVETSRAGWQNETVGSGPGEPVEGLAVLRDRAAHDVRQLDIDAGDSSERVGGELLDGDPAC